MDSTIHVEDPTLAAGFTTIPNYIIRHKGLTPGAKLAYVVLLSYAWQDGSCFPGQARMAEDMGVGERSLRRYLGELENTGFVVVTQRGLNQTNVYTLPRYTGPAKSTDQGRPRTASQDRPNRPTTKTQVKTGGYDEEAHEARLRRSPYVRTGPSDD